MTITDEARTMLQELMTKNNSDGLKASVQKTCCGTSLAFNLAKVSEGEEAAMINGISVLMTDEARERADTVTISVQKGELEVTDEAPSGCC